MDNTSKRYELKVALRSMMETLRITIDYLSNDPLAPLTLEQRENKIWAMKTLLSMLEIFYLLFEKVGVPE